MAKLCKCPAPKQEYGYDMLNHSQINRFTEIIGVFYEFGPQYICDGNDQRGAHRHRHSYFHVSGATPLEAEENYYIEVKKKILGKEQIKFDEWFHRLPLDDNGVPIVTPASKKKIASWDEKLQKKLLRMDNHFDPNWWIKQQEQLAEYRKNKANAVPA